MPGTSRRHRIQNASQPSKKDEAISSNRVTLVARAARTLVNVCAAVLASLFAWLKLKGVDFGPIIKDLPSDILFKSALALYFLCWARGLVSDTDDQELVYKKAPNNDARLPRGVLFAALIITSIFGILCWVDSYAKFTVFLAVFMLADIIAWRYLISNKMLGGIIDYSFDIYREKQEYVELEQLKLVAEEYLRGSWHWKRFAVGCLIVLALGFMAFSKIGFDFVASSGRIPYDFLISALVMLFVLIMEGWIWLRRLRMKLGIRLLDELNATYDLVPHNGRGPL